MKRYFAPMEGITGFLFRNAYEKYYGGIDKYFVPFMSPADNCDMTPKERRDVLPENNPGIVLVPQILTCKAPHFMGAADRLQELGYREINLNLGCPSGTVCAKGKGSGFLSEPDKLEQFLDTIYEYAEKNGLRISVKTRVGRWEAEEWERLLRIYNRFPISELIVHPRLQTDYYNGEPRMELFERALEVSTNPLVYNGNLFTEQMVRELGEQHDIMLGRGLLFCPELLQLADGTSQEIHWDTFWKFHDEVYHEYQKIMFPDINALHRMKELWTYWRKMFPDQDKMLKIINKSKKYGEYESAIHVLKGLKH